jgi:hypothetical protein
MGEWFEDESFWSEMYPFMFSMELLETMKNGSVVSWHHINLHVEYDFSDDKLQDSVGLDLPKILGILEGKKWEVKNQAKVCGM